MKPRGRHWLFLWLVVFLAVAGVVIARDAASYRTARELTRLREQRLALEAARAELVRRLRVAGGRSVLVPRAERELGLRHPTDSEYLFFTVPLDSREAGD